MSINQYFYNKKMILIINNKIKLIIMGVQLNLKLILMLCVHCKIKLKYLSNNYIHLILIIIKKSNNIYNKLKNFKSM